MENKKNSEYPGKGETDMKIIARIRSDFPTKFGIPRQSGRVEGLTARIVFEPEYRVREAVKGLEGLFTYLADLGIFGGCT